MADCEKCLFVSVCKKRPKMPGAKIAECNTFRERLNKEKPMTNADRIRAMSDEELAWELMTWRLETEAKHHGIESNYPNTQKSILEWLKQPAEVSNNA